MSERDEHRTLLSPETLGNWMIERWHIWQMRLLDTKKLAKFSKERGVELFGFLGKDIQRLWQLGLLRADYVRSSEELRDSGLIEVVKDDDEQHIYVDARYPAARPEGWIGAAANLEEPDREVELFFHPFRFYVVHNILHPVLFPPRPNISPAGTFNVSIERSKEVVGQLLEEFNDSTRSDNFLHRIEHLNDVVGLVIATEPCVYRRMFGMYHIPLLVQERWGSA